MSLDLVFDSGTPTAKIDKQDQALSFVVQTFWTEGSVPTKEALAKALGVNASEAYRLLTKIKPDLEKQGIPFGGAEGSLSPQQIALCNIMGMADRKSEQKRLNDLNAVFKSRDLPTISMQQWSAWKRQPAVRNYLSSKAKQEFAGDEYKFYSSIRRGVEEGDLGFTKFYGEVSGLYNPKLQIDVSIPQLVTVLFDILSRFLEPEQLEVIGLEIEKALEPPRESTF